MTEPTTTAEWNTRYPIGTSVIAYPGARPEDDPNDERLVTRTRSEAQMLDGHTAVVWVDGHGACIALTHVDPVHPAAEPTSHVEQQVQARIQAARVKIQAARQRRDELSAARRRGLAARHANKLWRQAERRTADQEQRDSVQPGEAS